MLLDNPEKLGLQYTMGTREPVLYQNSQNYGKAPTLDRIRAWKPLSNLNGFRQRFHARATWRTPDKIGSPSALKILPLSLSTLQRINLGAL
jgi:hypothetical protein